MVATGGKRWQRCGLWIGGKDVALGLAHGGSKAFGRCDEVLADVVFSVFLCTVVVYFIL